MGGINSHRGLKRDASGFMYVNFSTIIPTGQHLEDDPFIFSSQVKHATEKDDYMWLKSSQNDLYELQSVSRHIYDDDDDRDTCIHCLP